MRSPVNAVWPLAPGWTASELSWTRPFDDDAARTRATVEEATEITHGDWLNGLRLISALSEPLLPAAKTTTTPRSATAFVAIATGSRGSNWRNELPHELFTMSMLHMSGWPSMWSYALTTAVVKSTSPIE